MVKSTFILSMILLFFSCPGKSQQQYADSLMKIIALDKHDETERRAYSQLAVHYFKSNPGKAKMYMHQLVPLATEANDYMRLSSSYSLLLQIYYDEGNADSAAYCANRLKTVAAKAPDDYKIQGNYNQAVGLYYKKIGDYKTALPYSLAAVKFAELSSTNVNGDIAYIGGQWLNAASVYLNLGQYNNAMDCNLKALRFFDKADSKRGQGMCYTNMSALYTELKQYDNALRSAQKSLELKTELNDNRGICTALEAIGQAYMNLKNSELAFSYYQQALKIAIAEKMPAEENTCYFNMAKIYAGQGKDNLAILYYNKSKELAIQMNNKVDEAFANTELAALYKSSDSLRQVEKILTTTLQTFKEAGSLGKESDNYKQLSEFYTANRQFDKAFEYNNKYHQILDSIRSNELELQIKKMEGQYTVEKKEKEITLLKKDKDLQQQKLQRRNLLLIGSAVVAILAVLGIWLFMNRNRLQHRMKELELRNQIAADLHDEVGSSLSSIHMLSQMVAQQDNETVNRGMLQRMSSNAKETMDKMGDIVWIIKPGEKEAVSLKQRMERFSYDICSSKNIQLKMELNDLEKVKLTMEQRKNIYLIFKEAVNNAVKYSDAKIIEIRALLQNKELSLLVNDFGKGFSFSTIKKGNGLDNMQHRTNEMEGKLEILSGPGKGTTVQLIISV